MLKRGELQEAKESWLQKSLMKKKKHLKKLKAN